MPSAPSSRAWEGGGTGAPMGGLKRGAGGAALIWINPQYFFAAPILDGGIMQAGWARPSPSRRPRRPPRHGRRGPAIHDSYEW